jgi:GT2 family glycosyltransferase
MNTGEIKVALIIPVFNRRETTLQALRSLSNIDTAGFCIQIYVVDDGSTDGTSEAIREHFPDVRLIRGDGTLHYAGGTNRGITAALSCEPNYIITANDDSVFHENFIQRLVNTAATNPRSVVGALLLRWNEPHKVFQIGQVWRTWGGGWQMFDDMTAFSVPQTPFEVECIVGNCLLLPAEAIKECGLMDELKFPYGWGDAQYLARIRKAGWKLLIDPKAYVWCEPNAYPPPLHTIPVRESLRVLFVDQRHPLNLKRQFWARWESAPTKFQAALAFIVYCFQLVAKAIKYGTIKINTVGGHGY